MLVPESVYTSSPAQPKASAVGSKQGDSEWADFRFGLVVEDDGYPAKVMQL